MLYKSVSINSAKLVNLYETFTNFVLKNIYAMKKYFHLIWAVALIMMLGACSDDKSAQTADLLSSVPSDAEFAGVLDLESTMSHLNIKERGGRLELPAELRKTVGHDLADMQGVCPSVVVMFSRGSKFYVTGYLDDSKDFKAHMEQRTKGKFASDGNVDLMQCADGSWVGVCGDQFWVVSKGTPDSDELRRYASQKKSASVLSKSVYEQLLAEGSDFRALGDITALTGLLPIGYEQKMTAGLVLNALFSNASLISLHCDFTTEEIALTAQMLTEKGQPAPFTLPLSKIAPSLVQQTALTANMIMAAGIPADVIDRLAKSFGNVIPAEALKGIDGTVAISEGTTEHSSSGVMQTSGQNLSNLTALVNEIGKMTTNIDGGVLSFKSSEAVNGKLDVTAASKEMKDAYVAVFANMEALEKGSKFSTMKFLVEPSGSSVKLRLMLSAQKGGTWL